MVGFLSVDPECTAVCMTGLVSRSSFTCSFTTAWVCGAGLLVPLRTRFHRPFGGPSGFCGPCRFLCGHFGLDFRSRILCVDFRFRSSRALLRLGLGLRTPPHGANHAPYRQRYGAENARQNFVEYFLRFKPQKRCWRSFLFETSPAHFYLVISRIFIS